MTWYVYLMKCPRGLYCGISTNPSARLRSHRLGKGAKSVKALGHPEELRTIDVFDEKGDALRREAEIKKLAPSTKHKLFVDHAIAIYQ